MLRHGSLDIPISDIEHVKRSMHDLRKSVDEHNRSIRESDHRETPMGEPEVEYTGVFSIDLHRERQKIERMIE